MGPLCTMYVCHVCDACDISQPERKQNSSGTTGPAGSRERESQRTKRLRFGRLILLFFIMSEGYSREQQKWRSSPTYVFGWYYAILEHFRTENFIVLNYCCPFVRCDLAFIYFLIGTFWSKYNNIHNCEGELQHFES